MADLLPVVNFGAVVFTVLAQVYFIAICLALIQEGRGSVDRISHAILEITRRFGLWIIFLIAASGTVVSLYYSDIIGYAPCVLCWYQRIAVYPIALLSAVALWKRDRSIVDYLMALATAGGLIAIYHNALDRGTISSAPCAADAVSCTVRYVSEVGGYVTIPMMSLTAFLVIIVIGLALRRGRAYVSPT